MKLFYTLFLLLTSTSVFSQDFQWLIKDGSGKAGITRYQNNRYLNEIDQQKIKIKGVKSPTKQNERNEFFFIFDDGSYEIRVIDSTYTSSNYIFQYPKLISYAYLTNTYAEDDPPELVSVNTESSQSVSINPGELLFPKPGPIYAIHDIVDYKDFTILLDHEKLALESEYDINCNDYKICYDLTIGNNSALTFTAKDLGSSNALGSTGTDLHRLPQANFNANNCIEFNHVQGNKYFNFSTEIHDSSIARNGCELQLSIYCGSSSTEIYRHPKIKINSNFHDPNFVKVDCVWNDGDSDKVKYTVSCYNDGTSSVKPIYLSVQLPKHIDPTSVEILNWGINCKYRCGKLKRIKVIGKPDVLKVMFHNNKLDGLIETTEPTCNQIAWFTFCADLTIPPPYELKDVPLFLGSPHSVFNTTPYPISTFKDPLVNEGDYYYRNSTENCSDCKCCKGLGCYKKIKEEYIKSTQIPLIEKNP